MEPAALADRAGVGIVTIRQLTEAESGDPRFRGQKWQLSAMFFVICRVDTLAVVRGAFEAAGVEFIDENGGGAGVRLRKPGQARKPK